MAFRVRCRHSAHARNRSRIQRHKEIRPALRATFPKLSHETDSIEAVPPRHVSIESFFFFRSARCAAFRWKRSPEPGGTRSVFSTKIDWTTWPRSRPCVVSTWTLHAPENLAHRLLWEADSFIIITTARQARNGGLRCRLWLGW